MIEFVWDDLMIYELMGTGFFVDDDEMSVLKEVEKVFPSVIGKMPSVRPTVVKLKTETPTVFPDKTNRPISKGGEMNVSSLPGYREMMDGLKKDREGKHEEAMRLYERAGELGNKGGFMNMGNCYMFGKGVKEDRWKGIEMWMKCGRIEESEVRWMRKLSNDRFVCGEELNLNCLF